MRYDPDVSSKGGNRRKRQRDTGRPSIFFIIAITLGLLLLVVAFALVVTRDSNIYEPEMLKDKDPKKAERVMSAMLKMKKIDVAALQRAYDGR